MTEREHPIRNVIAKAGLLVFLAILPFLPLLAALLEGATLGTNHVENAARKIGVHEELGYLYEPVVRFFQ